VNLSDYLKKLRMESGKGRLELARQAGCSEKHVWRIERGQSLPSPLLLQHLLQHLEADKADIQRAWVLRARGYLPPEVQRRVDVTRVGIVEVASSAAVEWVKGNLGLPDGEEWFLRSHIKQRMEP